MADNRRIEFGFYIVILITLIFFVLNIFCGSVDIPSKEVLRILLGSETAEASIWTYIIREVRFPHAVTALVSGGGLGVAGLLLQTTFRNPLAGPSILGISSGAGLGVALVMLWFGGSMSVGGISLAGSSAVITGALAGSMIVMAFLMYFSYKVRSNLMLLITGMMTGYLTSSLVTLLSSLSNSQGLQGYVSWGMGTFDGVTGGHLVIYTLIIIGAVVWAIGNAKALNIMMLGEENAVILGIRVRRVRYNLLIITGILTAIITAYCGPISFVGMAMPHIARMIMRTDNHFVLIPVTFLLGAVLALMCNVTSTLPENNVIPLNALTPIVGVPVILYIILKRH